MKCPYQLHDGLDKHSGRLQPQHCPSEAHEGIVEENVTWKGLDMVTQSQVTFYCSHHRRVVEAKATLNRKVGD